MTGRPLLALALCLAGAMVVSAGAASADIKIGVAGAVKPDVTGTVGATTQPLNTGHSLFTDELVQTGQTGAAQLLFLDETTLSIGPQSDVKLDKFVYNPATQSGSVVFETSRGVLRFISGSQKPGTYQLKTPVATIGFRGTIGESLKYAGLWFILCVEGQLQVLPIGGGETQDLLPGQVMIVKPDGTYEVKQWDNTIVVRSGETSHPILVKRFADDYLDLNADPNLGENLNDTLGGENSPPDDGGCDGYYGCGD